MSPQEAIDVLKKNYPFERYEELREAVDEAIDALEKQIPMKMMEVLDISGRPIRVCGNCEDAPGNGEFCRWCGQRIDFER